MAQVYWEMLKDPRWQKKRLEILEAHRWRCDMCFATDRELNVHHGYYRRDAAPWEYEDETLHVLCVDCHKRATDEINQLRRIIARVHPMLIHVLLEDVADWVGREEERRQRMAEAVRGMTLEQRRETSEAARELYRLLLGDGEGTA